jgi:hypothetical protein
MTVTTNPFDEVFERQVPCVRDPLAGK